MAIEVDILEDYICQFSPDLLTTLLKDHTTSKEGEPQRNIFWGTSDYAHLGDGYDYHSPIFPHLITGDNGHVIMPRILKSRDTQSARSRDMAEVFTPFVDLQRTKQPYRRGLVWPQGCVQYRIHRRAGPTHHHRRQPQEQQLHIKQITKNYRT